LIDNPKGNFQFLKGSGPYSSGAVASGGYEVVHAIFNPLPGLWDTFGLIELACVPPRAGIHLLRFV